tara:strand:+ start:613 stop:1272 length:660 start_codon:yes stop_codon:yes gene_type:complete
MAQDSMRTGPEGASPQAAKLKKRVVQFHTTSAAVDTAGAETAIAAAVKGPAFTSGPLIKATAIRNLYVFPGIAGVDTYGGEYIVTKLWVQNTVEFATNPVTVSVGIYARNAADGVIKAVDVDCISRATVIGLTDQASVGQVFNLQLNGTGVGVESYDTAGGNAVSMKLGKGTALFADDNTDVTGQDQFLVITTAGTSAGVGECGVFAEIKPVGGPDFSN